MDNTELLHEKLEDVLRKNKQFSDDLRVLLEYIKDDLFYGEGSFEDYEMATLLDMLLYVENGMDKVMETIVHIYDTQSMDNH